MIEAWGKIGSESLKPCTAYTLRGKLEDNKSTSLQERLEDIKGGQSIILLGNPLPAS